MTGNKFLENYPNACKGFKRVFYWIQAPWGMVPCWMSAGDEPRFPLYWDRRHYEVKPEAYAIEAKALTETEINIRDKLLGLADLNGKSLLAEI